MSNRRDGPHSLSPSPARAPSMRKSHVMSALVKPLGRCICLTPLLHARFSPISTLLHARFPRSSRLVILNEQGEA